MVSQTPMCLLSSVYRKISRVLKKVQSDMVTDGKKSTLRCKRHFHTFVIYIRLIDGRSRPSFLAKELSNGRQLKRLMEKEGEK